MEKSVQLHAPATLSPGKKPRTLWIRGWVISQPVWTFQRREKSHVSTGVRNPYLAACSVVAIAHSFTQTTQWTKTSNQHTLHIPVRIMVLYIVCHYANRPRWYMELLFYWICLSCGLYLKLFVSSAHTCTKQHYITTVISFTCQKVDKGTSQRVTAFVKHM